MSSSAALAPAWLRTSLGVLLALGIVLPFTWDKHETIWGYRALGSEFGELPLTAQGFVVLGAVLGLLVLLRPRFGGGRGGALAIAVAAAAVCAGLFGWGERLVDRLGGAPAILVTVATGGIVAGLAMALLHEDERGHRVAAATGAVVLLATFLPVFSFPDAWRRTEPTSLWSGASAASSAPGERGSQLPWVMLGAGCAVCLLAASLALSTGRASRARVVAWGVALPLVMASAVVELGAGVGVPVEHASTWFGFVVFRLAPAAAVLGLSLAELVSAGRSDSASSSGGTGTVVTLTLTAADHARKLRGLRKREQSGELDAHGARTQRVAVLRAAVADARTDRAAARALLAEVARLEADGVLPAAEAQSVRAALPPS